jgi:hypothetical protein
MIKKTWIFRNILSKSRHTRNPANLKILEENFEFDETINKSGLKKEYIFVDD